MSLDFIPLLNDLLWKPLGAIIQLLGNLPPWPQLSLGLALAFKGPGFAVRSWLFSVNDDSCVGNAPILTWEIRTRESCQHMGELIGTSTLLEATLASPWACHQWEPKGDFPLSRSGSDHVTQLLLPNNLVSPCDTGFRPSPNEDSLFSGYPGLPSRPPTEDAYHFCFSRLGTQSFGKR